MKNIICNFIIFLKKVLLEVAIAAFSMKEELKSITTRNKTANEVFIFSKKNKFQTMLRKNIYEEALCRLRKRKRGNYTSIYTCEM